MAKSTTRGVELYVENPATVGYVKVGNLTSIPIPGPTKPEVDLSDFDSVAAEFAPGLPDYGSMAFTVNYDDEDAGQEILFDDAQDPEAPVRSWRVDFTQRNKRFEFEAYVASFVPKAAGINQAITADGSLRVTGAVTRGAIV